VIALFKTLFAKPAPVPEPAEADWDSALSLPLFHGLTVEERQRLRALALELLRGKRFSPVADAVPSGLDIAAIAAQAALPVLNLGAGWYKGWNEVVLYPAEFVHEGDEMDEIGVVHQVRHVRTGEAWEGGPLVLSLDSVRDSGRLEGYNVVIHEFAHKLDMNSGAVNGFPPMHGDMSSEEWSAVFGAAYADFCAGLEALEDESQSELDPYAGESPAEFFAVMSEYFFEWPELLVRAYPAVYEQMRRFYRQDPLQRLTHHFGTASGASE
jgi:Mlc titration factor MtfA (ptsG expression regulator)